MSRFSAKPLGLAGAERFWWVRLRVAGAVVKTGVGRFGVVFWVKASVIVERLGRRVPGRSGVEARCPGAKED
jgi:hypothetical protein